MAENQIPTFRAAAAACEQETWRVFRLRGAKQSAQGKNAIEDAPGVFIDGHLAFGMELA